ncbi:MAG: response regulator [Oligoflexales bacterium]
MSFRFPFPLEVALIDDEEGILDLLGDAVEGIPELTPLLYSNPVEAFEAIKERKIRIVFTDLDMPNLRGDQLIQKCKKLDWNVDVIVMSAAIKREIALKCFDTGAREVLIKPSDISRVDEALNRIVERYKIWHSTCNEVGFGIQDRTILKMNGDEEI